MGNLIAIKKNIINKIRAWTSLRDSPDPDLGLTMFDDSIKSDDPIDFITYLIINLGGLKKLKLSVAQYLKTGVGEAETVSKNALSYHTTYGGSEQEVPVANRSMSVGIEKIDPEGRYKLSPGSQEGKNLYPADVNSFHHKLYKAVSLGEVQTIGGIDFSSLDGRTLKIDLPSASFETIKNSFLADIVIFDPVMFTRLLFNMLFGKDNSQDILGQEIESKVYGNIIKGKEDKSFNLTSEELEEARKKALERIAGNRRLDLGCGTFESNMSQAELDTLINDLPGDIEGLIDGMDTLFNKSVDGLGQNTGVAREGFFKRLLGIIKIMALSSIFGHPGVRLLFMIMKGIKNGQTNLDLLDSTGLERLRENKNIIKCVVAAMMDHLSDFLLDMVKDEIKRLARAAALKILYRLMRSRIEQLQSLLNPN